MTDLKIGDEVRVLPGHNQPHDDDWLAGALVRVDRKCAGLDWQCTVLDRDLTGEAAIVNVTEERLTGVAKLHLPDEVSSPRELPRMTAAERRESRAAHFARFDAQFSAEIIARVRAEDEAKAATGPERVAGDGGSR